jgi:hypothetical protein
MNGHAPTSVMNVYEANGPAPVAAAEPAIRKKSSALLIVAAVLIALLLCCGVLAAIAVPVFLNASTDARQKACFANQRTVAGGFATYVAIQDGAVKMPSDWDQLMSLLVPSVLKAEPKCPAGGVYSISPGDNGDPAVSCSVHGSAGDQPTP